jgi:hypothetical protein
MEHVLAGVCTDSEHRAGSTVLDQIDVSRSLIYSSSPAIDVTVNVMPEEPPQPERTRDEHREYESDRRGEHIYPDSDAEERPSQRERDELKKRMDRGK